MHRPPVPLAWQNLTHDWVRFALFAVGHRVRRRAHGRAVGIMNAMLDSNTVAAPARSTPTSCSSTRTGRRCCSAKRSTGGGWSRPRACPASRPSMPVYLGIPTRQLRAHRGRPERRARRPAASASSASIPTAASSNLPEVVRGGVGEAATCPAPRSTTARAGRTPTRRTTPARRFSASSKPGMQTELAGRDITLVGGGFELGLRLRHRRHPHRQRPHVRGLDPRPVHRAWRRSARGGRSRRRAASARRGRRSRCRRDLQATVRRDGDVMC